MDTDPVLGHYRPTLKSTFTRSDIIKKYGEEIVPLWKKKSSQACIHSRQIYAGISMNPVSQKTGT